MRPFPRGSTLVLIPIVAFAASFGVAVAISPDSFAEELVLYAGPAVIASALTLTLCRARSLPRRSSVLLTAASAAIATAWAAAYVVLIVIPFSNLD